jgi:hypothetical protein
MAIVPNGTPTGWNGYSFTNPSAHISDGYLTDMFYATLPSGLSADLWYNIIMGDTGVLETIKSNFPDVGPSIIDTFYTMVPAIFHREYFNILKSFQACASVLYNNIGSRLFNTYGNVHFPEDFSDTKPINISLPKDLDSRLLNVVDIPLGGDSTPMFDRLEHLMRADINYTKILYSLRTNLSLSDIPDMLNPICERNWFEVEGSGFFPRWELLEVMGVREVFFLLNPLPRPDVTNNSSLRRRVLDLQWG